MFVDHQLSICVAYGTSGGPSYKVLRIPLKNGKVRRKALTSIPTYRFTLLYKNLLPEHYTLVRNAFNATLAGTYSFRFKDWTDFEAVDEPLAVAGTGGVQSLQLIKTYTFGSRSVQRPIRKPVTGTVTLTADGAPLAASINYDTGIATFTAGSGDTIRWSGEFDVPAMFVDDDLPFSIEDKNEEGFFLTGDISIEEDTDA